MQSQDGLGFAGRLLFEGKQLNIRNKLRTSFGYCVPYHLFNAGGPYVIEVVLVTQHSMQILLECVNAKKD